MALDCARGRCCHGTANRAIWHLKRRYTALHFHFAPRVFHPNTRIHARLLGPCFKTGRLKPFRQHLRTRHLDTPPVTARYQHTQQAVCTVTHRSGRHGAETLRPLVAVLSTPQSTQRHLPQAITLGGCPPSHLPATILPLQAN